jgi:hypothetical protein
LKLKTKKAALTLILSLGASLVAGCGLLPKNVEFGQKKVKPIPEMSDAGIERQKEAAHFIAEKAQAAKEAALATFADVSVVVPITEATVVSRALETSLGPPITLSTDSAPSLAKKLEHDRAKVDQKIDKQREKTEPLVGKKIEGTGWLQIGYLTYLACIAGLVFLVWAGLKVYGIFNPAVGAGLGIAERIGSKTAALAFSQTAHGIESVKNALKPGATYTAEKVKEMLATHLQMKQDSHVQELVRRLTPKP